MLALAVFALLTHPRQRDVLMSGPASPAVAGSAVDKLVRYLSVNRFDVRRAALTDVGLAGEVIRAGETVVLALAAANRDPRPVHRPGHAGPAPPGQR